MIVQQRNLLKADVNKIDIADLKIRHITESTQLDHNYDKNVLEKVLDVKTDEELVLEELLKDKIEYGTNFDDLERFNRTAYNDSDSEEMNFNEENNRENTNNLPTINVYHDMGAMSRELLTIETEHDLRKRLTYSYLNTYWNKMDTKYISENILVGTIANKIPITPLLYTIKLNNYRESAIKSDIDYNPTSESEQSSERAEDQQDEMGMSIFNQPAHYQNISISKFSHPKANK